MTSPENWTAADLPDQTAAPSSSPAPTAASAWRRQGARPPTGARIVLAVRDTTKGETAAAQIDGETEVRRLDLADLASIRAFADELDGDIDVLINNAGVMNVPLSPHRRRLRDADRHQPSRPLRADQPAAARGSPTAS